MKKLLLILLLLWSSVTLADVATVIALKGTVIANNSVLVQGSKVSVGDTVQSKPRSFAVLQFVDGASLTIRPDSEIVITEYQYEDPEQKAEIGLVSGGLRLVTGAIAKQNPDQYKVNTPVALMGVRGTEFSIYLCGDEVCETDEDL